MFQGGFGGSLCTWQSWFTAVAAGAMRTSRGTRSLELWETQLGQGQMEVLGVGSLGLQGPVWQTNIGKDVV